MSSAFWLRPEIEQEELRRAVRFEKGSACRFIIESELRGHKCTIISPSEVMSKVIDLDGVSLKGAWFMLDGKEKKMELFQYGGTHPTPNTNYKRKPTDLGFTFSIEVLDIQEEYQRLKEKGEGS